MGIVAQHIEDECQALVGLAEAHQHQRVREDVMCPVQHKKRNVVLADDSGDRFEDLLVSIRKQAGQRMLQRQVDEVFQRDREKAAELRNAVWLAE